MASGRSSGGRGRDVEREWIGMYLVEVGTRQKGLFLGAVDHLRAAAERNAPAAEFGEAAQGDLVGAPGGEALIVRP